MTWMLRLQLALACFCLGIAIGGFISWMENTTDTGNLVVAVSFMGMAAFLLRLFAWGTRIKKQEDGRE